MNILAIYDPDSAYTLALTAGLNARADFNYECFAFTEKGALENFTREQPPVILLIDKTSDSEKILGRKKLYLVDQKDPASPNEICKFQSVERIAGEIENASWDDDPADKTFHGWKQKIHRQVLDCLDLNNTLSDAEILAKIGEVIRSQTGLTGFSENRKEKLKLAVFASLRKMDILSLIMEDPEITEIMVNGPQDIFIERRGKITRYSGSFLSEEKLTDIIQQIAALVNRRINESSPMVDARLQDGSRVNLVVPPVALSGPCMTIRRFPETPFTMEDLIRFGSISVKEADFLKKQVIDRKNIFISGGTGTGKTTFLGALADFIPKDERVITIEDSAELQLKHIENLVRLEARPANLEGDYEITIRMLIKNALRQRADRLVVGEVRSAEALDMLTAFMTGHSGSLSTGHANSAGDMLYRIETMVLTGSNMPLQAIRSQIISAIDLVVHLERTREGLRRVEGIYEMKKDERVTPTLVRIEL